MVVEIDGWSRKRVFLTGHTGFKGSWLSLLLSHLGADVTGYSLEPSTNPSLFERASVGEAISRSVIADIRDYQRLEAAIHDARPDVVFHLAAQPLVRYSYDHPVETYSTNVMGTVHLLEAVRQVGGVKAVIAVTSDKCYENREWVHPYRETDPMGGHDPYSSSKGCSELVVSAYRSSYFSAQDCPAPTLVASVRAGNVIGGGDWSLDRLVPDLVRAFEAGKLPVIRSPGAIRPWQHVLEALAGYIAVAQRLLAGDVRFADAWNFGPGEDDTQTVSWIVNRMARSWGIPSEFQLWSGPVAHEAELLRLDSSKARAALGWRPALRVEEAIDLIVDWHKSVSGGASARAVTMDQIHKFLSSNHVATRKAA
jgi:CDP-glucose 4,6-dehydratase